MLDEFIKDVSSLYSDIKSKRGDSMEKFQKKWNVSDSLGDVYQDLTKKESKKQTGSFYTPHDIVNFMVDELTSNIDYSKTPFIKILDPSCGGGDFLVKLFEVLREKAKNAGIENPEKHVIEHSIYGFDIDRNGVMITSIELFRRSGILSQNIKQADFLTDDVGLYDIIIGNPPYMGHKVLTGEYRERLYELYRQVFSDKSDISYCFIKKSIDSLKRGGYLSFLTSRYILEALNGSGIRNYIKHTGSIKRIIDFYGIRLVKGAGVDNIILEFQKTPGTEGNFEYLRLKSQARNMSSTVFDEINSKGDSELVKRVNLPQSNLKDNGWIFLDGLEERILNKINGIELNVLCESYQGIITGCDEAFVVSPEEADKYQIEKNLLFPWIKSKDIQPFNVLKSSSMLIYADYVENEEKYSNAVKFISRQKERLSVRRECAKGMRKWYGLQWGRNPEIFLGRKIIYPFKASSNRFAIDEGSFFSADIYSLKIRDMFAERYSYEFLVGVLNSSIYEFYIKSMAKKLGEEIYEYYPNKILNLKIPHFIKEIENEVKSGSKNIRYNIDMILVNYFGMTLDEYAVIRSWCI